MNKFDYENSMCFIINRVAKALIHAFDQELRNTFGISFGQWKIIIILVNNDGGLTQKDIADKLGLEGATLIPIIDKLEKDGFVTRMVDKNDRRNNRICLTEKTISLLDLMVNFGLKIKEISIRNIPEQNVSITKDTLEKMLNNIQNEFSLNPLVVKNEQKRNSTAQGIGFNTSIQ